MAAVVVSVSVIDDTDVAGCCVAVAVCSDVVDCNVVWSIEAVVAVWSTVVASDAVEVWACVVTVVVWSVEAPVTKQNNNKMEQKLKHFCLHERKL